ncbi:serine hydrolase domain-containing protein [Maribacter sp. 4G9]|uniref:serine hydrolase domain-containing protein n=1 Tax=Maribacter sp. 4G9 TaxID=1889777 RepID=UPI000C158F02|nr:serine hydrolase [Maribacter sp. 4G9]PIB37758.1 serine hydrolase [Maribacter sp. 4G9]
MKKLTWAFALVLVVLLVFGYLNYPKLNLISGYASKNLASNVFLAQRDAYFVNVVDHDMPLINLATAEADSENKSASASVYGLMERISVYKEGLGAVLTNTEHQKHNFSIVPERHQKRDTLPFPYGNQGVKDTLMANVDYDALEFTLTRAMQDSVQKTRSLLVVYKNQIIGEKYTDEFNKDTKILGWSMTKSILGTLYGILEFENGVSLEYRPFEVLYNTDGPKSKITLNHLLRMQSGLAWDEDYFKISDVTKMLFLDSDMTLAQANNVVIAPPTEIWNYSSGTSNLLSGILRKQFATHQEYLNFPYAKLIDRIGMHSMLIETDLEGNFVGSSYGWATTRDWAKFGLLYLHRGDWNGDRIFSDSWVDYITKPTEHSNGTYGAHFWLNAEGKYPDLPRDLYSANGFQGQRVFIIPSKDMVIVRTGLEEQTDEQFNTLISDILKTIR